MSSQAVKRTLSGSVDGEPILVAATSSPGTVIDTAVSGTTPGTVSETWLYASNIHTADVVLTLEIGANGRQVMVTIPSKSGLIPVRPGLLLQNSKVIKAFASMEDVVSIDGFVNSITD